MNTILNFKRIILSIIFFLQFFGFGNYIFGQTYPAYTATVFDSAATTGYYFFSPKFVFSLSGIIKETQMILDRYGDVVYYHTFPIGKNASDFKIQPNGLMTYIGPSNFYIMDSTFSIIDSVHHKGVRYDQHDFQILPNGHFLFLGAEEVVRDLSSYLLFRQNNIGGSKKAKVRCAVIQEQDANQNVVFEWHCKDYFLFDDVDNDYLYDTLNVDWTHSNSVELDYDGNILLSTRHFNEITKINRSDSSIIWRLGGKKNQFTFTNDAVRFRMQHDGRRIANGHITLFDNGYKSPFHPANAKEYSIDETLKTATLVWNYTRTPSFVSQSRGNVQRINNGNTVTDYGRSDGQNIVFDCVNAAGVPVFEVTSPDTLVSYRAYNYPQLPWNINRPKIKCDQNGGQIFLSVDSGLSSYIWSTGNTTYKIAITDTGTYYVFIPRGSGGFIKSEKFVVSNLTNACGCPLHALPGLISGPSSLCQGTSANYSVSLDSTATSYSWLLPSGWSGSSNSNSISIISGAQSGLLYVRANDSCGSSNWQSTFINIIPVPDLPSAISGKYSPCPNTLNTYSVSPVVGANSYTWTLPAGWSGSSSSNSINVFPSNNGGTITVFASNGCGAGPVSSRTVSKGYLPSKPASIIASGGNTAVCQGDVRSYSVNPVSNTLSYTWIAPPGASISSGQGTTNITVVYGSGFVKSDSLQVTSDNNCGSSAPRTLLINYNGPAAPGVISGSQYGVCSKSSVNYSVTALTGLTYIWSFDNTNATVSFGQGSNAINGDFTSGFVNGILSVKAFNACGISAKRTLIIEAVPKSPALISGPTTVCLNQQGVPYSITAIYGANSYTWNGPTGCRFSDGITTSTSATFTTSFPSVTANFKTTAGFVKVKANNVCGSGTYKSLPVAFNCRDESNILPDNFYMSASPNPAYEKINISFVLPGREVYELQLLDLAGRTLILEGGTGMAGSNEKQIDADKLSKGTYLLKLITEKGNSFLRVIVN